MNFLISFTNNFVWGPWLLIIIASVGIIATVASKGFQFRYLGYILRNTFGKLLQGSKKTNEEQDDSSGQLSPFQAISMAIGGAVGTGNIGGVATAIAVGGPGAIVWMFIASLLGMITKMMEVTLAVHYRMRNINGDFYGGPTYYMQKGLGEEKHFKLWFVPAFIFGFGLFITVFLTMTTYNVADAMYSTTQFGSLVSWGWIYSISTFTVIIFGIKGVAKVAERCVPFMCLFYVISAIIVILLNIGSLPSAIALIFKSAFTPIAAVGGFSGATVALCLNTGFKRALYSNEAGWGTSPMIHASAKVDHPIKQGIWGVFEVFVDTCIVCTLTGLVIVITGVWDCGLAGASLTLMAFESGIGIFGRWIIAISVFLFAFSTTGGWWVYNEILLKHFLGKRVKLIKFLLLILKVIYPFAGIVVCYLVVGNPALASGDIWVIADIGSGLPTWMNLICLFFLVPKFIQLLNDYKAKYMGIGKIDPNFRVFYNDDDAPVLKTTELKKAK